MPELKPHFVERWITPGAHWVWLSVAIFGVACGLPAFPGIFDSKPLLGWVCLHPRLFGYPPWWANPVYAIAVIASLAKRFRTAAAFACVATSLAMTHHFMLLYENKSIARQALMLPGCICWISSIQILTCHELWRLWQKWKQSEKTDEIRNVDSTTEPTE